MNIEERSYLNRSLFPEKGENGIIYIDIQNDLKYRWSLDRYVLISSSPALKTTTATIPTISVSSSSSSLFEKINIGSKSKPNWIVKPLKIEKNTPGIVSDSFISCRGLDPTTATNSGGITRGDLFTILSGEPLDSSEFINNGFLRLDPLLKDYATKDWVTSQKYLTEEIDPSVPEVVKNITEIQINSWDLVTSLLGLSNDKSYIYVTENRGLVSNSFISCRGLDSTALQTSNSLTRDDLFTILSSEPLGGESINLNYLIGLKQLVDSFGYLKDITYNQVVDALGYIPLKGDDFKDFITISNITQQDIDNWNFVYSLIGLSEDQTYLSPKENRGFVSNSFISCKGFDNSSIAIDLSNLEMRVKNLENILNIEVDIS